MTAGISRSGGSSNPASLFRIEIVVRFREQFFDALAVAAVRGNANARRKDRLFRVASKDFADAVGDTTRFVLLRLWKNQGEFVAAISRGGIDCPAVDAEGIGKTADGAAADEMAKVIVDFFQPIEIKQQNRERPTVAIGAVSLGFQDVEQAAVVSESGERITHGKMAHLFKEPRIVEKGSAQRDSVAQNHERLCEDKRSVQQARGLGCGKLSGQIQPGGSIDRAIERGILDGQAATEPDEAHKENRAGQQLLRIREKGTGMVRNFRRQAAKGGGDNISESNYSEQSAGDFTTWMTRTRQEVLDEKRHHEQKRQSQAAKPPGERRPEQAKRSFWKNLKKENAGGG